MNNVTKPAHYNSHPSGIECRVIARHHNFNIGNVIKYVWRAGLKGNAPAIDDLQKAVDYLNDEIKMLQEKDILDKVNKARRKFKKAMKKYQKSQGGATTTDTTTDTTADTTTPYRVSKTDELADHYYCPTKEQYWCNGNWFDSVWICENYYTFE